MHRFDEQFMLKEANRKMQMYETRAVVHQTLRELKRSRPLSQRLAHALVQLAERLDAGRPAVPCEGTP